MVIEVRDLRKLGTALEAEEGILVGESVAIKPIFRRLEGESADAVLLHATAFFEVEEEA